MRPSIHSSMPLSRGNVQPDIHRQRRLDRQSQWQQQPEYANASQLECTGQNSPDDMETRFCTSLELLLHPPQRKRKPAATNPLTEEDPEPPTQPDLNLNNLPLSTYLEYVIRVLVHAHNTKDIALLTQVTNDYFAPSLQVNAPSPWSYMLHSVSVHTYIANSKIFWTTHPLFHSRMHNATSLIHEEQGKASIFATQIISGLVKEDPKLVRENVSIYHFKCRGSRWVGCSIDMVVGPGHVLDEWD